MKEKMLRLYKDWRKAQDNSTAKKADSSLKETIKNPANFTAFTKLLGSDSSTFINYFNESKKEFSDNIFTAKRKAAEYLLEEKEEEKSSFPKSYQDISQHYTFKDGTNGVISNIEIGKSSGNTAEILRAIVGGNMQIAAALTFAAWSELSVYDRNAIFNLAQVHGGYNTGSENKKEPIEANYFVTEKDITDGPYKKKSDCTKQEFLDKVFPYSDPKYMKLYSDKD
jgi:hypothetical protein